MYKDVMKKKVQQLISNEDKIHFIKLESLVDNPYQPRIEMKKKELIELANSIKEQGLLQPVIVTPLAAGLYTIIAGHRRVAAHKILNKETIKAIVLKKIDNQDLANYAIIENLQRKNLNIIEMAIALKQYKNDFNKSFDEIAKELGKSKTYIIHLINLLKLPNEIIKDIKENQSTTDITALNMLNSIEKKVSVSMLTDEVEKKQIELYYYFLKNGRDRLKQKIQNLINNNLNKKKNYNIKQTSKSVKLEIYKKLDKEQIIEIEKFIQKIIK